MQAVNCNIVLGAWKISTKNTTSEACPRKTNVVEKSPKYRIGREKEKSPAGNDVI